MDGARGVEAARGESPGWPEAALSAVGRGSEVVMARIIAKGVAHRLSHPPNFWLHRGPLTEIAGPKPLTTDLRRRFGRRGRG